MYNRQQAACELWREEFNWERPHESLDGRCPGAVYRKSDRQLPDPTARLDYGPGFFPRKVNFHGCIRRHQQMIFVSNALVGCHLGLRVLDAEQLEVWLNYLLIGTIELQTSSFRTAPSRCPEAARLSA